MSDLVKELIELLGAPAKVLHLTSGKRYYRWGDVHISKAQFASLLGCNVYETEEDHFTVLFLEEANGLNELIELLGEPSKIFTDKRNNELSFWWAGRSEEEKNKALESGATAAPVYRLLGRNEAQKYDLRFVEKIK